MNGKVVKRMGGYSLSQSGFPIRHLSNHFQSGLITTKAQGFDDPSTIDLSTGID